MTTEQIPFGNLLSSGLEELAGMSPMAMNVVMDQSKTVKRRPGLTSYAGYPIGLIEVNVPIVGVYGTNHHQLFAIGDKSAERPIYSLTPGGFQILGGFAPGGTAYPPHGLRGNLRPVFAETELLLTIAGGDLAQKIELSTLASSRLGSTTPAPNASHIIANNTRLLANDMTVDRTKVRFSDTALGDSDFSGNEVWSLGGVGTSGYFTAEAKPDDVVAVLTTAKNVLVLGTGTTQVFQPDPDLTYAPIGTMEVGIAAPYSAVRADESFFWLDNNRRFIMSDGSGFEDISAPIKRELDAIATIRDCFGYRCLLGFVDAICWTFPTDGRTFVFQKGYGWAIWTGFSDNNWAPFQVHSHCLLPAYAPSPGMAESTLTNFIGTRDGHVGKFSLDATTDFGTRVPAKIRTGFLNHKTDAKKHCQRIWVKVRRGNTASRPQGSIRFRDSPGEWASPLPIDFGESGDTEMVLDFPSLGTYRARQWEWEFSETEDMTLVSVIEEFQVLRSG